MRNSFLNVRKHVLVVSEHRVDRFKGVCFHLFLVTEDAAYHLLDFTHVLLLQLALKADYLQVRE